MPDLTGTVANAVTGVYGLTKSGKTSLLATAAEYCWERFHRVSRLITSDLGGFGTKMLSLVRVGIVQAYYPRTHVNPFATMEDLSLGAWPETILAPDTGMADPNVRLIMPRSIRYRLICPCGQVAGTFLTEAELSQASIECPACKAVVTPTTCARTTEILVQAAGFDQVGLYLYDSFSSLNEWGLATMAEMSAYGQVGDAMDAATALTQGRYKFGLNSKSHFGFVQNRTPQWIANIRAIPGQAMSPIATFLVEASKGDDESGGIPVYGPKIAGNARTSTVGQWLGHLLYCTIEPDDNAAMRHRLWTETHVDPRDPRAIPYLAGHRGEPEGIPPFLEDDTDESGKIIPFSGCSLKRFFSLLDQQAEAIAARDYERYADAPAFKPPQLAEVIVAERSPQAVVQGPVAMGGRGIARRGGGRAIGRVAQAAPAAVAAPAAPVVDPNHDVQPGPVVEAPTATATADRAFVTPVISAPAPADPAAPRPPQKAPMRLARRARPGV